MYTLATKILQGNQPLLMTAPGVNDTSPATFIFCTYNVMSCTPLSEKSPTEYPTEIHIICNGMPATGSYNGITTLNYENM